ncbi:MAG: polysaccharide lyase [Limnospira sp.]
MKCNATRRAIALSRLILGSTLLGLAWGCSEPVDSSVSRAEEAIEIAQNEAPPLWSGGFADSNWRDNWEVRRSRSWGLENLEVIDDPTDRFDRVLRVVYPKNSATPSVSRKEGVPIGGAQFLADLGMSPADALRLSYHLRFSENFDFVKGGKLPGLFGGSEISGGEIPDGTNGFSTRLMWRRDGDGEVYAYLPTSEKYGTSVDRGAWRFVPGRWYHIEQEVVLNEPGLENGRIRLWVDGNPVIDRDDVMFRTTDELKIEGIFFSTFFGGGDLSWATPEDVYVDFAEFSVSQP